MLSNQQPTDTPDSGAAAGPRTGATAEGTETGEGAETTEATVATTEVPEGAPTTHGEEDDIENTTQTAIENTTQTATEGATGSTTEGTEKGMGAQSQNRRTQQQRANDLRRNTRKRLRIEDENGNIRKRDDQGNLPLNPREAFDATFHCGNCKARHDGTRVPKRRHHDFCPKKQKKLSKADKVEAALRRLHSQPFKESEKCSWRHSTEEAGERYFAGEIRDTTPSVIPRNMMHAPTNKNKSNKDVISADVLCERTMHHLKDDTFMNSDTVRKNTAPIPMVAFAKTVMEKIVNKSGVDHKQYFSGLTMTVPACKEAYSHPEYHSIVGQKLMLVDWEKMFDIKIGCTLVCGGTYECERNRFSHNRTLFPIFGLDGPPSWAMVCKMVCNKCGDELDSNHGGMLLKLAPHVSRHYPVEPKYALNNHNSHLGRTLTEVVMDSCMNTYGNGDMISKMIYQTMNNSYKERALDWVSYDPGRKPVDYVARCGQYIKTYPPTGDQIRDWFDEASKAWKNYWYWSDNMRHTLEIQMVICLMLFAQDHTFQVIKNYLNSKQMGVTALWDLMTETGEVATAVLVPSTQTKDFAHAAMAVSKRKDFNPKVHYSDTFPNKKEFWELLFSDELVGRLGLFHYMQRIIKTLKKNHIDYQKAISDLTMCIYSYNKDDMAKLTTALLEGTLSEKFTVEEIQSMRDGPVFRKRYDKYLRKEILPASTIRYELDKWFIKYKVDHSPGKPKGGGRKDPRYDIKLFTEDTSDAVDNCKEKAEYLQDPPDVEMYEEIKPNPNSEHGLSQWLSRRGESSLESFHLLLAHFANNGMRESLVDALNLTGTARHNMRIRHKRRLAKQDMDSRCKMPAAWEDVVPYYNHAELAFINSLAAEAGVKPMFDNVEELPDDNGERFFSQYQTTLKQLQAGNDDNDLCTCQQCQQVVQEQQQPAVQAQQPEQQQQQQQQQLQPEPPTTNLAQQQELETTTTNTTTNTNTNTQETNINITANVQPTATTTGNPNPTPPLAPNPPPPLAPRQPNPQQITTNITTNIQPAATTTTNPTPPPQFAQRPPPIVPTNPQQYFANPGPYLQYPRYPQNPFFPYYYIHPYRYPWFINTVPNWWNQQYHQLITRTNPYPKLCCEEHVRYLVMRARGQAIGRPPHNKGCQERKIRKKNT